MLLSNFVQFGPGVRNNVLTHADRVFPNLGYDDFVYDTWAPGQGCNFIFHCFQGFIASRPTVSLLPGFHCFQGTRGTVVQHNYAGRTQQL